MVSLFENFFAEDTVTRVGYKYDTHNIHYKNGTLQPAECLAGFVAVSDRVEKFL